KQYTTDLALSLLITLVVLDGLERGMTRRRFAALAALVVAAPWFSHASTFVIAGSGTVLLAGELAKRRWRDAGAPVPPGPAPGPPGPGVGRAFRRLLPGVADATRPGHDLVRLLGVRVPALPADPAGGLAADRVQPAGRLRQPAEPGHPARRARIVPVDRRFE